MKIQALQTEIDTAFLYGKLAEHEKEEALAKVYSEMSKIELAHALAFSGGEAESNALPGPSWRAKTLHLIAKIFGYDVLLGVLMDTEKGISKATVLQKKNLNLEVTGMETSHVKILRAILEKDKKTAGLYLSKFEKRHRSVGGNAIRAAVLGGNDGLVSNFSLVMGVAGAASNGNAVLLAGSAGLLAGALSMALGEWISVKSSQELYENQMNLEMEELKANPEGEKKEMALIYMAKGIPEQQAHDMAEEIMKDTSKAHQFLVKEELGINAEELQGSAMEAALFSFALFAVGALIPVLPFLFLSGTSAIIVSTSVSAMGLFLIGAAITLFTGKNVWFSGFRQVFFGLFAAAISFGVGHLIGVSLA